MKVGLRLEWEIIKLWCLDIKSRSFDALGLMRLRSKFVWLMSALTVLHVSRKIRNKVWFLYLVYLGRFIIFLRSFNCSPGEDPPGLCYKNRIFEVLVLGKLTPEPHCQARQLVESSASKLENNSCFVGSFGIFRILVRFEAGFNNCSSLNCFFLFVWAWEKVNWRTVFILLYYEFNRNCMSFKTFSYFD